MPVINPPDAATCSDFLEKYRDEIINKTYDICASKEWIDELADDELFFLFKNCKSSKWALACSKKVTANISDELAKDSDAHLREILASNINTSPSSLMILAMANNDNIKTSVARNPNTPSTTLNSLAKGSSFAVKVGLICNPNLPATAMEMLANDNDHNIRKALICERQDSIIPYNIYQLLAADKHREVRSMVASVRNTPKDILNILAKDPDNSVRERARNALGQNQNKKQSENTKSGCFIATAAMGSPLAYEVIILSRFRDEILIKNSFGKQFVRSYYLYSPIVANFISKDIRLQQIIATLFIKPLSFAVSRLLK